MPDGDADMLNVDNETKPNTKVGTENMKIVKMGDFPALGLLVTTNVYVLFCVLL